MMDAEQLIFAPERSDKADRLLNGLMWGAGHFARLLSAVAGDGSRGQLSILTYHRVVSASPGVPDPSHNVSPDQFRRQLLGLLKYGYRFWRLTDVLERAAQGESIPPRTIVITFDDGFESVYWNAWPIMRDHGIPATIFLNTRYLGQPDPFPFDVWGLAHRDRLAPVAYRPLTKAQCHELLAGGIELGAHTHTHQDFRNRPLAFKQDMESCLRALREDFGIESPTFAFPYGSPRKGFSGGVLKEAARQCGVLCALTTQSVLVDPTSDPFHWGRYNVFPWDSAATLRAKCRGWYSWAPQLRQRLLATNEPAVSAPVKARADNQMCPSEQAIQ